MISIIPKAARPLLQRTAAFLGICIVLSGLIGPRIISHGLLARGHFDIYGGIGKALLFGVVALALLIRHHGRIITLPAWNPRQATWFTVSAALFAGSWVLVTALITGAGGWRIPLTHVLLLLSIIAAGLGCFGVAGIRSLYEAYRRQLVIAVGLTIGFYLFLLAVYAAWQPLAATVLHSAHWMFGVVGLYSDIIPPRSLLFDKFGIEIAQYCSGIESIALFTGLYAVIALLDWDKFNHRKLLAVFFPALLLLFACNILRVFVLIAAGYYINPQIAFSLFHTYAGMVFFLLYSGIFWTLAYKWLLAKSDAPKSSTTKNNR